MSFRYKGMSGHMRELKQDLSFMLVSFQLRKVQYIEKKEVDSVRETSSTEQAEIEDETSRTINRVLNAMEDLESFLFDKLNEESISELFN
jgi:hypothetical protein